MSRQTAITLSDKEMQALADFTTKHKLFMACNKDVVLQFDNGSGIGTNIFAKCLCGEEKDITDYGAW